MIAIRVKIPPGSEILSSSPTLTSENILHWCLNPPPLDILCETPEHFLIYSRDRKPRLKVGLALPRNTRAWFFPKNAANDKSSISLRRNRSEVKGPNELLEARSYHEPEIGLDEALSSKISGPFQLYKWNRRFPITFSKSRRSDKNRGAKKQQLTMIFFQSSWQRSGPSGCSSEVLPWRRSFPESPAGAAARTRTNRCAAPTRWPTSTPASQSAKGSSSTPRELADL